MFQIHYGNICVSFEMPLMNIEYPKTFKKECNHCVCNLILFKNVYGYYIYSFYSQMYLII